MYRLARRSLIVTRDLPPAPCSSPEMITVKRPGFGIAPKHLELVLGRALRSTSRPTTSSPGTWFELGRGGAPRRRWR